MKTLSINALLLVLCLNFIGCYGTKKQVAKVQESLPGKWELSAFVYEKNTLDGLFPTKRPTLFFDTENSTVSGTNGCNSFSGPIFTNRLSLTFIMKKMNSTKMACVGDGEKVFMNTLSRITSYRIDEENKLELFVNTQRIMTFKRAVDSVDVK